MAEPTVEAEHIESAIAEPPISKNLAQKILEIQSEAGIVKKKGKFGNEGDKQRWDYLRIEDAVIAVNKLLAAKGLLLTATLQKKPDGTFYIDRLVRPEKGYIVSLVMQWTIEDVETGEHRSWDFPGEGYDGTDKGTYKAETGSRKYAIINIFNLPVGNDVEEKGAPSFEEGRAKQKAVAANQIAAAAARGNKIAIDAMSQEVQEKILRISRPEEYNGHYIIASGFIAVPALDTFFNDTGCKRIDSRKTGKTGWKVPAEYEKGLLSMCQKLEIEIEG